MTNIHLDSTPAWTIFTIATFVVAAGMMAGGIYFLEASFSAKGFYAMSAIMLVHTSITVTKTLRDIEEAGRRQRMADEMSTTRLLQDVGSRTAA